MQSEQAEQNRRQKIDQNRADKVIRRTAKFCGLGLLVLMACLQHFALTLPQPEDGLPEKTDGLVVPTGGQARIQEGLYLLHNSRAERMLITGVGQTVSKRVLASELNLDAEQLETFSCCVDIDKTALDTKGNAEAALVWAEANQFSTLRLVTANYHLPRAYLEFSRLLTDKQIDSWAVIPPDLQPRDWFRHWPTVRLLAREYAKYLFALVRL